MRLRCPEYLPFSTHPNNPFLTLRQLCVKIGRLMVHTSRWNAALFVPEGRLIIAQRFIAGYAIQYHSLGVPEGRLKGNASWPTGTQFTSVVPDGTLLWNRNLVTQR